MTLPKDRLRKIHGLAEPTGPADPAVLARRKYHQLASMWCAKCLVPLQAFFASFGFFIVLLPTLSKPWRGIVENTPLLAKVFHDYSTFSGLALVNLFAGMLTAISKPYWSKSSPRGPVPSHKTYLAPVACPATKKEEFSFWIEIVALILVTTVWLFLPFGVMAYFLRMGA
ncbi:MAG: hypothetical protein ACK4R8_08500 [Thiobacillus sp.]